MKKNCLLCGTTGSFIFNSKGYNVYRCNKCNFGQISDPPTHLQIKKIYSDLHFKHQMYRDEEAAKIENLYRFELVKKHFTSGSLLDVGCGSGDFLRIASERYKIFGIDVSSEAINLAKVRLPMFKKNLRSCMIEELVSCSKQYDVVCLWDVIEHIRNPLFTIQQTFDLVKKNGILFISTPDFGSIMAKVMKKNWAFMIPPLHTCFFSKKAFDFLAKKIGAKPLYFSSKGKTVNLSFLFYKLNQINKKIFPEKALRILNNTAFGKLKIYIPTNDILYLGFRK